MLLTPSNLSVEAAVTGLALGHARIWGFRTGDRGTHTSRTIMLSELSSLLDAAPGEVTREDYVNAVLNHNCLRKRTVANRKLSLQRLTELYGLSADLILFRVLRDLWDRHKSSRPLLGLLLALARDPLLRAVVPCVIETPFGHVFARQTMKDALANAIGDRLNESTVDKVVRNASSSWTQSGHLEGRVRKTRQRVQPTPAAAAYALLIGFAMGRRGLLLFETPWAAVLDAGREELIDLTVDAKRLGLLDLKQSGSMIDVSFPRQFTEKELELIHGAG